MGMSISTQQPDAQLSGDDIDGLASAYEKFAYLDHSRCEGCIYWRRDRQEIRLVARGFRFPYFQALRDCEAIEIHNVYAVEGLAGSPKLALSLREAADD